MNTRNSLRPISIFLALVFIWGLYGCVYWHRHERPTSALPRMVRNRTGIYLVSHDGNTDHIWKVEHPVLTNDSIKGDLRPIADPLAGRILHARSGPEARKEQNKVLLHVDGALGIVDPIGTSGVPLSRVVQIESFDVNTVTTVSVFILSAGVCIAVMALLVALLKTSCPFVYSHSPDGIHFEGEIFSGAIYPQLERHDRLPMPHLQPVDGRYRITLANKAKEVQSTDLLKLITVDHARDITALFDKYGAIHAIGRMQAPLEARDLNGTDIREQLRNTNDVAWMGDPLNHRPEANDGMDLVFARPSGSSSGKLVITARNSFWVDHLYNLFLDEQGRLAPVIDSLNCTLPADQLRAWSRAQRMPLAVWLEQRPGTWKRVDQFELAGPMAWRPDVLELDLRNTTGDQVHLRLDCGFQFWEIDQVAMDFTPDTGLVVHELDAIEARDQYGTDVSELLAKDDDRCYVQPEVDDAAEIVFPVPELPDGLERSLFLHGAGHYRILHETVPISPDLFYLKSFKKADALPNYSRDRWNEIEASHVELAL